MPMYTPPEEKPPTSFELYECGEVDILAAKMLTTGLINATVCAAWKLIADPEIKSQYNTYLFNTLGHTAFTDGTAMATSIKFGVARSSPSVVLEEARKEKGWVVITKSNRFTNGDPHYYACWPSWGRADSWKN